MNYRGYLVDEEGNKFYPKAYDSGWKTATLTNNFKPYDNDDDKIPQYRKSGNIVEIKGEVSPKETIKGSNDEYTIFTFSDGFRPDTSVTKLCQGSGSNKWLLTIRNNGDVNFSRYGTNSLADASSSAWLVFDCVFFCKLIE